MVRLKKNIKKQQRIAGANLQKIGVKKDKEREKNLHLEEVSEQELLYWRVDVYPYLM